MSIFNGKHHPAKKIIALFTACTFSFSSVVWSSSAQGVSGLIGVENNAKAEAKFLPLANRIEIPETLGSVRERFVPSVPSAATVIHIQDAHISAQAQQNIRKILEHLNSGYGVNAVFLEGAFENLRPELLKFFKDEKLNEKAAERFMKESLVGGTELYLLDRLNAGKPAAGFGAEEPGLYLKNLRQFRFVQNHHNVSDKFLEEIKAHILTKSSNVFNKELKEFFREWVFYQESQDEMMRHLATLDQRAKDVLKLDLRNPRSQLDWPQLVRYLRLKDLDGKIDPAKALAEKKTLEQWIKDNQIEAGEFAQLLAGVENPQIKSANPRLAAEKFFDAASPKGFGFEKYPELSKSIGSVILQSEIQANDLFDEMKLLTQKIFDGLVMKDVEKELLAVYADYLQLKKVFSLEMVREEYESVLARRSEMQPSAVLKRLSSIANGKTGSKTSVSIKKADSLFSKALLFYKAAILREDVMFKRLTEVMKDQKKDSSVLVTGGFHSKGIAETLKKNNIAYIEITPRITDLKDTTNYMNAVTMKGDPSLKKSYVPSPRLITFSDLSADIQGFVAATVTGVIKGLVTVTAGIDIFEPQTLSVNGFEVAVSDGGFVLTPSGVTGSGDLQLGNNITVTGAPISDADFVTPASPVVPTTVVASTGLSENRLENRFNEIWSEFQTAWRQSTSIERMIAYLSLGAALLIGAYGIHGLLTLPARPSGESVRFERPDANVDESGMPLYRRADRPEMRGSYDERFQESLCRLLNIPITSELPTAEKKIASTVYNLPHRSFAFRAKLAAQRIQRYWERKFEVPIDPAESFHDMLIMVLRKTGVLKADYTIDVALAQVLEQFYQRKITSEYANRMKWLMADTGLRTLYDNLNTEDTLLSYDNPNMRAILEYAQIAKGWQDVQSEKYGKAIKEDEQLNWVRIMSIYERAATDYLKRIGARAKSDKLSFLGNPLRDKKIFYECLHMAARVEYSAVAISRPRMEMRLMNRWGLLLGLNFVTLILAAFAAGSSWWLLGERAYLQSRVSELNGRLVAAEDTSHLVFQFLIASNPRLASLKDALNNFYNQNKQEEVLAVIDHLGRQRGADSFLAYRILEMHYERLIRYENSSTANIPFALDPVVKAQLHEQQNACLDAQRAIRQRHEMRDDVTEELMAAGMSSLREFGGGFVVVALIVIGLISHGRSMEQRRAAAATQVTAPVQPGEGVLPGQIEQDDASRREMRASGDKKWKKAAKRKVAPIRPRQLAGPEALESRKLLNASYDTHWNTYEGGRTGEYVEPSTSAPVAPVALSQGQVVELQVEHTANADVISILAADQVATKRIMEPAGSVEHAVAFKDLDQSGPADYLAIDFNDKGPNGNEVQVLMQPATFDTNNPMYPAGADLTDVNVDSTTGAVTMTTHTENSQFEQTIDGYQITDTVTHGTTADPMAYAGNITPAVQISEVVGVDPDYLWNAHYNPGPSGRSGDLSRGTAQWTLDNGAVISSPSLSVNASGYQMVVYEASSADVTPTYTGNIKTTYASADHSQPARVTLTNASGTMVTDLSSPTQVQFVDAVSAWLGVPAATPATEPVVMSSELSYVQTGFDIAVYRKGQTEAVAQLKRSEDIVETQTTVGGTYTNKVTKEMPTGPVASSDSKVFGSAYSTNSQWYARDFLELYDGQTGTRVARVNVNGFVTGMEISPVGIDGKVRVDVTYNTGTTEGFDVLVQSPTAMLEVPESEAPETAEIAATDLVNQAVTRFFAGALPEGATQTIKDLGNGRWQSDVVLSETPAEIGGVYHYQIIMKVQDGVAKLETVGYLNRYDGDQWAVWTVGEGTLVYNNIGDFSIEGDVQSTFSGEVNLDLFRAILAAARYTGETAAYQSQPFGTQILSDGNYLVQVYIGADTTTTALRQENVVYHPQEGRVIEETAYGEGGSFLWESIASDNHVITVTVPALSGSGTMSYEITQLEMAQSGNVLLAEYVRNEFYGGKIPQGVKVATSVPFLLGVPYVRLSLDSTQVPGLVISENILFRTTDLGDLGAAYSSGPDLILNSNNAGTFQGHLLPEMLSSAEFLWRHYGGNISSGFTYQVTHPTQVVHYDNLLLTVTAPDQSIETFYLIRQGNQYVIRPSKYGNPYEPSLITTLSGRPSVDTFTNSDTGSLISLTQSSTRDFQFSFTLADYDDFVGTVISSPDQQDLSGGFTFALKGPEGKCLRIVFKDARGYLAIFERDLHATKGNYTFSDSDFWANNNGFDPKTVVSISLFGHRDLLGADGTVEVEIAGLRFRPADSYVATVGAVTDGDSSKLTDLLGPQGSGRVTTVSLGSVEDSTVRTYPSDPGMVEGNINTDATGALVGFAGFGFRIPVSLDFTGANQQISFQLEVKPDEQNTLGDKLTVEISDPTHSVAYQVNGLTQEGTRYTVTLDAKFLADAGVDGRNATIIVMAEHANNLKGTVNLFAAPRQSSENLTSADLTELPVNGGTYHSGYYVSWQAGALNLSELQSFVVGVQGPVTTEPTVLDLSILTNNGNNTFHRLVVVPPSGTGFFRFTTADMGVPLNEVLMMKLSQGDAGATSYEILVKIPESPVIPGWGINAQRLNLTPYSTVELGMTGTSIQVLAGSANSNVKRNKYSADFTVNTRPGEHLAGGGFDTKDGALLNLEGKYLVVYVSSLTTVVPPQEIALKDKLGNERKYAVAGMIRAGDSGAYIIKVTSNTATGFDAKQVRFVMPLWYSAPTDPSVSGKMTISFAVVDNLPPYSVSPDRSSIVFFSQTNGNIMATMDYVQAGVGKGVIESVRQVDATTFVVDLNVAGSADGQSDVLRPNAAGTVTRMTVQGHHVDRVHKLADGTFEIYALQTDQGGDLVYTVDPVTWTVSEPVIHRFPVITVSAATAADLSAITPISWQETEPAGLDQSQIITASYMGYSGANGTSVQNGIVLVSLAHKDAAAGLTADNLYTSATQESFDLASLASSTDSYVAALATNASNHQLRLQWVFASGPNDIGPEVKMSVLVNGLSAEQLSAVRVPWDQVIPGDGTSQLLYSFAVNTSNGFSQVLSVNTPVTTDNTAIHLPISGMNLLELQTAGGSSALYGLLDAPEATVYMALSQKLPAGTTVTDTHLLGTPAAKQDYLVVSLSDGVDNLVQLTHTGYGYSYLNWTPGIQVTPDQTRVVSYDAYLSTYAGGTVYVYGMNILNVQTGATAKVYWLDSSLNESSSVGPTIPGTRTTVSNTQAVGFATIAAAGSQPAKLQAVIVDLATQSTSIVAANLPAGVDAAQYHTQATRMVGGSAEVVLRNGKRYSVDIANKTITAIASPYYDVQGKSFISPLTALIVINVVNTHGNDARAAFYALPWADVNGDGLVTAIDVLLPVNYLNLYGSGSLVVTPGSPAMGEGEPLPSQLLTALQSAAVQLAPAGDGAVVSLTTLSAVETALTNALAEGETATDPLIGVSFATTDPNVLDVQLTSGVSSFDVVSGTTSPDAALTTLVVTSASPTDPKDVNGDGKITANDVLIVINYLNANGPGELAPGASQFFVDVNGDGRVTALDALLLVNELNAKGPHAVGIPSEAIVIGDWFYVMNPGLKLYDRATGTEHVIVGDSEQITDAAGNTYDLKGDVIVSTDGRYVAFGASRYWIFTALQYRYRMESDQILVRMIDNPDEQASDNYTYQVDQYSDPVLAAAVFGGRSVEVTFTAGNTTRTIPLPGVPAIGQAPVSAEIPRVYFAELPSLWGGGGLLTTNNGDGTATVYPESGNSGLNGWVWYGGEEARLPGQSAGYTTVSFAARADVPTRIDVELQGLVTREIVVQAGPEWKTFTASVTGELRAIAFNDMFSAGLEIASPVVFADLQLLRSGEGEAAVNTVMPSNESPFVIDVSGLTPNAAVVPPVIVETLQTMAAVDAKSADVLAAKGPESPAVIESAAALETVAADVAQTSAPEAANLILPALPDAVDLADLESTLADLTADPVATDRAEMRKILALILAAIFSVTLPAVETVYADVAQQTAPAGLSRPVTAGIVTVVSGEQGGVAAAITSIQSVLADVFGAAYTDTMANAEGADAAIHLAVSVPNTTKATDLLVLVGAFRHPDDLVTVLVEDASPVEVDELRQELRQSVLTGKLAPLASRIRVRAATTKAQWTTAVLQLFGNKRASADVEGIVTDDSRSLSRIDRIRRTNFRRMLAPQKSGHAAAWTVPASWYLRSDPGEATGLYAMLDRWIQRLGLTAESLYAKLQTLAQGFARLAASA